MQLVVRTKGAELHELEEEAVDLVERHNTVEASVGLSEKELVDKVLSGALFTSELLSCIILCIYYCSYEKKLNSICMAAL